MHILATTAASLDETATPVDLRQSPAPMAVLSFSDSDLSGLAAAWAAEAEDVPELRLVPLRELRHPMSVDLWLDRTGTAARVIVLRLLGGLEWWRYGAEQLAASSRRHGIALAVLPGEDRDDPSLAALGTLPAQEQAAWLAYFRAGGKANLRALLRHMAAHAGRTLAVPPPAPLPPAGAWDPQLGPLSLTALRDRLPAGRPVALIVFYRSLLLAEDAAPVAALAQALAERGMAPAAVYVGSLKQAESMALLARATAALRPEVIVTTTAFAAGEQASVLTTADVPVVQAVIATTARAAWADSPRGLGAADLAMHVVLPELDGRGAAGVLSFKERGDAGKLPEFVGQVNRAEADRVAQTADRIAALVRLRQAWPAERRLAVLVPDYPGAGGRTGYAVGLDVPASVLGLLDDLAAAGYAVAARPDSTRALIAALDNEVPGPSVAEYTRWLGAQPAPVRDAVLAAWGAPEQDAAVRDGVFYLRALHCGAVTVAVAPDRGHQANRRADWHDAALPPRHALLAFGLWLRRDLDIDAVVHMGAHGSIEWLPGKAVALTGGCFPELVLGALPVLYPFLVSNPGEAAQARRRIGAVTLGHLPPRLAGAGLHGQARELERLLDELAAADGLDQRRRERLARLVLQTATPDAIPGLAEDAAPEDALRHIDAWLCDLKELAIKDGLHVWGRDDADTHTRTNAGAIAEAVHVGSVHDIAHAADADDIAHAADADDIAHATDAGDITRAADADSIPCADSADEIARAADAGDALRRASAEAERAALLHALDGGHTPPGPGGSPGRGRTDILPTGRNLYAVDPRGLPTRTALDLARLAAEEILRLHLQEQGEHPSSLVVDLWGSATLRTGGEEIALGLVLMGCRPVWDDSHARVTGVEVLPCAAMGRPRIDVTWRISGLFRDLFPAQIALLDAATRAVAARDEIDEENPLAAAVRQGGSTARIFGAAPGAYGSGVEAALAAGDWSAREELGRAYLAAASHVYAGADGQGRAAPGGFAERVAGAQGLLHVGDDPARDLLEGAADAAHLGGFAAAADLLGTQPLLLTLDTTHPSRPIARPLATALARLVHGRVSPRFIAGQMRHGPRGAAEFAETVDRLVAFAETTDAVPNALLDQVHDAYLADPAVLAFLRDQNQAAARAIAGRLMAARRRGLWHPRRNGVDSELQEAAE